MASTYSWAVTSLTAYPQLEGQTEVVFQVSYVCSATDGTYNSASYGVTELTYEAGAPFTPFDQLTLPVVIGWVHAKLGPEGVAAVEAQAADMIEAQRAPKPEAKPLPWNTPVEEPALSGGTSGGH